MFVHIKAQVVNLVISERRFTIDQIMHLHIKFQELELVQSSFYTEVAEWIAKKKGLISPNNNNEQCFKWAVIAALHHEDLKHHLKKISLLQYYEDQ